MFHVKHQGTLRGTGLTTKSKHSITLAIINQKGGVGKSTTTVNLAAALGEKKKEVLVIDLDPQGNTTSGFGIDKKENKAKDIYNALLNNADTKDLIIETEFQGVSVIPATIELASAELDLAPEMAREMRLKEAIGQVKENYDYIIIDCPPSLGLLTVNALTAADSLIIPIQCEYYALEGVVKLLDSMKMVKKHLNPDLTIFGVLLTLYDGRTTLAKQVVEEVQNFFGDEVFDTIIPRSVKLSEAPSYGQPITVYNPKGKGAIAYRELAKEVIKRG